MKKDISTRADIELLITRFYDRVKADSTIGYIFTDVAKVNWDEHLPAMFNFWENVILFTGEYRGNPMAIHQQLNKVEPLTKAHFKKWEELFLQTIDEYFDGEKATLARQRALSISTVLQLKVGGGK